MMTCKCLVSMKIVPNIEIYILKFWFARFFQKNSLTPPQDLCFHPCENCRINFIHLCLSNSCFKLGFGWLNSKPSTKVEHDTHPRIHLRIELRQGWAWSMGSNVKHRSWKSVTSVLWFFRWYYISWIRSVTKKTNKSPSLITSATSNNSAKYCACLYSSDPSLISLNHTVYDFSLAK